MQNLIQPSITSEDNKELTRMPSEGEIKETIFSMGSFCGCFFCEDVVDGIGKEVRRRLTLGFRGRPRG